MLSLRNCRPLSNGRLILLFAICSSFAAQASAGVAGTIGGFIYDEQRNPVVEVDVELLNENYATRGRVKTNGIGRYEFSNVADGTYYIRVMPFRYNLEDSTERVIVDSLSILGGGFTYISQDFYLRRKQGGLGETTTGVIFAQEIPKSAEEKYNSALEALDSGETSEATKLLVAARNEFPNYFAANHKLGMVLLTTKRYEEAARVFMLAAGINPKSSVTFYYMGFALSQMGKEYNPAALKALEKARVLAPSAYLVPLLEGKLLRQEGDFVQAEKSLISAKKLANNVSVPEIHMELSQLYGNDLKQYGKAADELELYLKASDQKDEKIKKVISDLRAKAKGSG
ncbi:MAG: carboxypeptidase regulatory-like domain-containing protein [Acidobacteriota bacterium]|nr:MAG: carboxypeptidase regulatory-like domain-containing protein [Acidobacteriota bacterium]